MLLFFLSCIFHIFDFRPLIYCGRGQPSLLGGFTGDERLRLLVLLQLLMPLERLMEVIIDE